MSNKFKEMHDQFNATVGFAAEIGGWMQAIEAQVKSEMLGRGWPDEYATKAGYETALSMMRNLSVPRSQND